MKKVIWGILFLYLGASLQADQINVYLSQTPGKQISIKDQFNTLYRSDSFLGFGIELETDLGTQMQWSLGILHSPDQKYSGGQAVYSSTSYYYKLKYLLVDFQNYVFYAGARASLDFASARGFNQLEGVDVGTGAGVLIGVQSNFLFGEYGYFFSTPTLRFVGGNFTDSFQEQTELKIGYRMQFNLIDLFPVR